MTEFTREVDEEYRREQLTAIFKKYGNLIIGVVLLIVIGVGGWQFLQWRQTVAAQAGAVAYEKALALSTQNKGAEAEAALAAIAAETSNPYHGLATLRQAAEIAKRDAAEGVKAYDAIAADATLEAELKNAARIRAGYLLVDTAALDEITRRIADLAVPAGTWRNAAREILGLAAYRAGDTEKAAQAFQDIAIDPAASQSMKSRAEVIVQLVRGSAKAK
jgi:hypothetical protein